MVGPERGGAGERRRVVAAAQAALAVLVLGGVVLAALFLRPGAGLFDKGRGPLGGNPLLATGLALLSLLGGLALREKYLRQVDAGAERDPVEQRLVDTVSRVLMAAPVVVPLLALALHRFDSSGGGHRPSHPPTLSSDVPLSPLPTPSPPRHTRHSDHGMNLDLMRVLVVLAVVLFVVVVVLAARYLWRYLTRLPAPEAAASYANLDDEQERLAQAVDSGRRALLDGDDARAAVIACYLAMEQSLAESGVTRRASDSPQDLLERAVSGGLPAGSAAAELTALFREARYSTHPMDGSHRDRAAAALAEIADGLRSRTSEPEAVMGTS